MTYSYSISLARSLHHSLSLWWTLDYFFLCSRLSLSPSVSYSCHPLSLSRSVSGSVCLSLFLSHCKTEKYRWKKTCCDTAADKEKWEQRVTVREREREREKERERLSLISPFDATFIPPPSFFFNSFISGHLSLFLSFFRSMFPAAIDCSHHHEGFGSPGRHF